MKLEEAIKVVLSLARENIIELDDEDLVKERDRQLEAISTVEDFSFNHLGYSDL